MLCRVVPYTDNSSKYHSPIFKSSVESAICLGEIAKEKRWNIIYKPHPMAHFTEEEKNRIPENVIIIERADINEIIDCSDVVITILSATAYDSLLRYTPTVMLGYNQLKSKGCTYDAFKKDEIVIQIEKAIKEGFTKEQQGIFLIHIAQLLKYYLNDDMKDREIRYGRPIPQTIEEVYELSNLLNVKLVEE